VAEGQVDATMSGAANDLSDKHPGKVCLYAGMLHEKYGVVRLVEAFRKVRNETARLVLYGDGDAAEHIRKIANEDQRIEYRGVADNRTVVQEELKATLLINPRPSDEGFTAYSFPSKNLEYMVSGTPVLTTKLPGMPREYDRYAYLFGDESVDGMAKTLNEVLGLSREELHSTGSRAKAFVLNNKSNTAQARCVLEFLKALD
jgi:glycosyltransferase involved in cell wall biosynthesis